MLEVQSNSFEYHVHWLGREAHLGHRRAEASRRWVLRTHRYVVLEILGTQKSEKFTAHLWPASARLKPRWASRANQRMLYSKELL